MKLLPMAAVALVSAMLGGVSGIAVWRAIEGDTSTRGELTDRVASLELEMSRFRDPPLEGSNAIAERGALPGLNSRWFCPDSDSDAFCSPMDFELNDPVRRDPPVARAWTARTALLTAEQCNERARPLGASCTETAFVVCATHDDGELNLCFRTWNACLKSIAANPDRGRICAAYFAGRRLKLRGD